ncbi:NUMOD4 domain-containing protein [Chitinophagaceae bacterium LB-8]|uniref:NUMOD4 domain-containing protein n=1 Tax=Paraflavisolibacter caeni TaxID=2982496 RepID=A0A9X3BH14_9BACT|nr:NUMOD4 domain-containing protein [Paraflavisolibacter caeni]MCU7551799.1 NUMOD4 domain-containing protein [Paraflavisolibacter caeni]
MQELTWVPVKNYEGYYEINEKGEVRSLHKRNFHEIMPQRIGRGGYLTVSLSKRAKDYTEFVHRLLAFTFISNPEEKPWINHKDGNKLNNEIGNLEWCTPSENAKHAYETGLSKVPEKSCRKVIDTCTNKVYDSASQAAKALNIAYSTCKNYLNGGRTNPTCLRYAA